jgi:hypothetical protein
VKTLLRSNDRKWQEGDTTKKRERSKTLSAPVVIVVDAEGNDSATLHDDSETQPENKKRASS